MGKINSKKEKKLPQLKQKISASTVSRIIQLCIIIFNTTEVTKFSQVRQMCWKQRPKNEDWRLKTLWSKMKIHWSKTKTLWSKMKTQLNSNNIEIVKIFGYFVVANIPFFKCIWKSTVRWHFPQFHILWCTYLQKHLDWATFSLEEHYNQRLWCLQYFPQKLVAF